MAEKRRFLDVWIIESNTVYREVPFMVVTDWVQQGRLLGEDRVRPSGTAEWYPIGGMPSLAAYMPKVQEHRADDHAEALEPVELEFTWKRRPDDDDMEVDMIPLIDVSLVLLIFFLMTTAIGAKLIDLDLPIARHKTETLTEEMKLAVGIHAPERNAGAAVGQPRYSLSLRNETLLQPTPKQEEFVARLKEQLTKAQGKVLIRIQGDKSLPMKVIKNMTEVLRKVEFEENASNPRRIQIVILGEVNEPSSP
jgi:biopolymer transport protein ExbD